MVVVEFGGYRLMGSEVLCTLLRKTDCSYDFFKVYWISQNFIVG